MGRTPSLTMSARAWDALAARHGWDECPIERFVQIGTGVTVTLDMEDAACTFEDMVDAARHCMHLEGWDDEIIEVNA